ncbi:serine-rich adhesin for platelets-like [Biomphalaria glabrata]|uniref:Serine-rich adhesin for platelets-like n=1 Tax=Biomphalaria glabrata TaxID=6526 RepID=A0A9W2YBS4_BIOGL|nr:serine-rich adhesin for platelets-like [Biomphalaria glabrata]
MMYALMLILISSISPVVSDTSGISFNVNGYTFIFDQQNLIKAMDCFNQTAYFCVIKTLYENNKVLTAEEISLSNMTLVAAGSETYSKYVKCASPSETSTQQIWCSRVHQNAALTQSDTAGSKCHALGVISNGTVLFQFNLIFHINDNVVHSSVQEVNTSRFEVSSCTQNSITSFIYHDSSTSVYTAAYTSSVPLTDRALQTSALSSYFSLITATLSGDFVHHTSNNSETTDLMSSLETFSHLSTMPMDARTASRSPQIASISILVDLFSDASNYIESFVTSLTREIVNASLIDVLALTSTFNFVDDFTKSVALYETSHVNYTFNDALTIEKSSTVPVNFTSVNEFISVTPSTSPVSFTGASEHISLTPSTLPVSFTSANEFISATPSTSYVSFTAASEHISLFSSTLPVSFTTANEPISLTPLTVPVIFTTEIESFSPTTSAVPVSFTAATEHISLTTSTVTDSFLTAIKPISLATSTVTDSFTTAIKPINLTTSTVTDSFTTAIKPINLTTSTVTDSYITITFITFSSLSSSVLSIISQTGVPTVAYEMNFTDFETLLTKSSFNITAEFSTRSESSGIVEPTSSSVFTNSQDNESKHLTSSMDVAAELSHIRETSINVDLDSIDSLSPTNLAPTVYTQNTESASFNTSVIRVTAATTLAMEFMNTNLAVSDVPAASLRNTETTSSNNLAIDVPTDFNTSPNSVHLAMSKSEWILRGYSTTSVDMLYTVQTELEDLLPTTFVSSFGILHSTHISSTEIPTIAPTMSVDILLKTSFTITDALLVPSSTLLDLLHTTQRNVEDISTGSIKTLYILPTPSATSKDILPTAPTSLVDILLTASVSSTDVPSMASSVPLDMFSTGSATTMDVTSASSDSSRDALHATQTNLEDALHSGLAQTSSIFLTSHATSEEILPSLKTSLADVLSSENTLKGASEMSVDIVLTSFNTTDGVILEPSTISATFTLVYLSYLDITTTSDIQTLLTASINVAPTVSSLTEDLLLQISTTSEHFFQLSSGSQEDVVSFDSTTLTPSRSTTNMPVDSADIDSSFLTDVSFINDLTSLHVVENTTLSFYVLHSTSSSELVSTAFITSDEYQATFSTIDARSKSINTTSIAMLYPTTFLEPSQTTSTYYIKSTLVKETPELIRTTHQLSTYTFYDGTGRITPLSTNTFSTMLSEVTDAINLIPSSTTFIAYVLLDATVFSEVQSEQILTVSGASKSQSSQLTSYLSLTLYKSSTVALNTAAETIAKSLEPFYTYLENSSQSYARKSSIIYDSLALFSNLHPIVSPSRSTSMTYELPLSGSSFFESSARSVSISTSTDTVSTVSSTPDTTSNTTKVISYISSYINTSEKNRIIGITFGVLGFAAVLIVLVFVVKKIRSVNRESRFRSEFDRASHYSC